MIPPFGFEAHQAMRHDMDTATQQLWREIEPQLTCLECGADDSHLRVVQAGGHFEEYSDECTACGVSSFNESVFDYLPR